MDRFRGALGLGSDWHGACAACLDQLADLPAGASLGFVYASDPFADALDLIAGRLIAATGIRDWVGTGGAGVCGSGQEHHGHGALAVLVASLPPDAHRLFDGFHRDDDDLGTALAGGSARQLAGVGVVHGDPRHGDVPRAIARLAESTGAFLVGGLTSAQRNPLQIAREPTEGGLSGVLLSAEVPVITGLSQGCTPIGPAHEVTGARGPWVTGLDGRPAVEVLCAEIGEVLARDLARIGGFIHAALPIAGSDRGDYMVRNLLAVDVRRGALALDDPRRRGDALMFVKRDGPSAQTDLERMLADLVARTGGRPVRGALYHSCIARGPHLFGPDSNELRTIERALGPVPLAGFFTNGEIFHDRLYAHTGVLTLFL